tara:strand:+ start:990 stop:1580 length:591 start_codon:yes stop_codon:yes gene_type:complete
MVGPTTFGYQNLGFGAGVSGALDYVLIQTQSPSGTANIDFTSIDESKYNIHFVTYTLKGASYEEFGCRFFESGSIEDQGVYKTGHFTILSQGNNEDLSAQIHSKTTSASSIEIGESSASAVGEGGSGYFYIYNAGDSNLYTSISTHYVQLNNSNNVAKTHGGGTMPQASTVDGFRIFGKNSGSNLTGKVSLYGVTL